MSLEKSVLRRAFTYGQSRWFSLPKCLIVFSACLQVYTSDTGAATNQTFRAFLRVSSVKPSPSLKSSERTTKPVTETTALEMFNSVSINHVNNLKPSSQVLISSRHTTWVVEPSLCTNTSTNFLGNDESVNSAKHTDEDKGVVFYKKIGGWITLGIVTITLVFLTVTHFSSIRYANKRGQIKEPYCSISQRPQLV